MVSPFTRRPGYLAYTVNGFAEEYYALLNRKYRYSPGPSAYEPGADVPVAHRYEAVLRHYAHLNDSQLQFNGFGDTGLSREALMTTSVFVRATPAFESRVRLIDTALDAWARENGLTRLATYLAELLQEGKRLLQINEVLHGKLSKNSEFRDYFFLPEGFDICLNGLIARVQQNIEHLMAENETLARAVGMVGTVHATPPAVVVRRGFRCDICQEERQSGYIICGNNHLICEFCLPAAIRENHFKPGGLQEYKCLFCDQTPRDDFIALILAQGRQLAIPGVVGEPARIMPGHARWQPDAAAPYCTKCGRRFSVLNRRHHCRLCGYIICSGCSEGTGIDRHCNGGCHR